MKEIVFPIRFIRLNKDIAKKYKIMKTNDYPKGEGPSGMTPLGDNYAIISTDYLLSMLSKEEKKENKYATKRISEISKNAITVIGPISSQHDMIPREEANIGIVIKDAVIDIGKMVVGNILSIFLERYITTDAIIGKMYYAGIEQPITLATDDAIKRLDYVIKNANKYIAIMFGEADNKITIESVKNTVNNILDIIKKNKPTHINISMLSHIKNIITSAYYTYDDRTIPRRTFRFSYEIPVPIGPGPIRANNRSRDETILEDSVSTTNADVNVFDEAARYWEEADRTNSSSSTSSSEENDSIVW